MKLYLVMRDSVQAYVAADDFAGAIAAWKRDLLNRGFTPDEPLPEPESVQWLADDDELVLTESTKAMAQCIVFLEQRLEAAEERVDLDVDEFHRIKAELDDLRIGKRFADSTDFGIYWRAVAGICDRAIAGGRQRVPLIEQRDKAIQREVEARADAEQQRTRAEDAEQMLADLRKAQQGGA